MLFDNSPLHLLWIAGFSLSHAHINEHRLLLCPCFHNACVPAVVNKTITFIAVGCILNFILLGDCDVSNPYSGICPLDHSSGSTSLPQWWYLWKSCTHSNGSSKSAGRYPSIWACGHLWVAKKSTLHILDENLVCCGDLQTICYFIMSCPSVIQNHGTDLFSVLLCGHGLLAHHFASVTSALLFLNWWNHSYSLL